MNLAQRAIAYRKDHASRSRVGKTLLSNDEGYSCVMTLDQPL
jgi:hypothetical protein